MFDAMCYNELIATTKGGRMSRLQVLNLRIELHKNFYMQRIVGGFDFGPIRIYLIKE
jgi:hypothetical protein